MLNSIKKARSYTEAMRSGQVKHQAVPRAFSAPPSGYGFYGQGTHYAQVLNYTAWAFIAIQALIREIAGGKAPNLGNVTERPEEDLRKSKSLWHAKSYAGTVRKNLGGPQEHEQFEPWPKNHPGVVLFRNPNSPYVAYDLWAYHTLFFHLSGECHWWALRDRMGIPRELWIIPTHWKRNITGPDGMPVAYEIRAPWGQVQYALAKDVVSFYEHSPLSMWEGLAVTTACGRWLDIYDSVMTTQLAMFKNGADPSLHVELDESYPNPDDAMLTRYYAKWFRRFQGETNAGLPVVTGPGVKVTKIGSTPSEIGFEASEEAIRNRVLAAFGVPQALVTGDPTVDTCHDEQTECLTAAGWVKYDQITEQTKVACFDAGTSRIVYRRPTKIIKVPYKGNMYRWKSVNAGLDALMTPKHKVWIKNQKLRGKKGKTHNPQWHKREVGTLAPSQDYRILTAAPAACATPAEVVIDPQRRDQGSTGPKPRLPVHIDPMDWVRFLGWYIAEGSTHIGERSDRPGLRSEVVIHQSVGSEHVEEIDRVIGATGLPFRKYLNANRNCWGWSCCDHGLAVHLKEHCGDGALNKKVPDYVKDWPAEYLAEMLSCMVDGDGTKYTKVAWGYFTGSKQLADDVQEVATKAGWRSSIVSRFQTDKKIGDRKIKDSLQYRVNILLDGAERLVLKKHRSVEEYDGIVWCLEVPTGIFVTRRNGCTLISSNSAYAPQRTFTRFTVNPKLTYMSQRITEKLLRPHWPNGCCWWDDRTPNSQEDIIKEIECRAKFGAISPNQVAAMFGAEPWPHGGDDPYAPDGSETNWATGKQRQNDVEMDKAFRKAMSGLDGASGGYLTPPQHRPLFRDEQDANEAHKSLAYRLHGAVTKNGNGHHKAHA